MHQCRNGVLQDHVVAGQLQAALHLRLQQAGQGQLQFQSEPGVAGSTRFFRKATDPVDHRAVVDEADQFLQGAGDSPVDAQERVGRQQIRYHRLDAGQRHIVDLRADRIDFHSSAVEGDGALDLLDQGPQRRLAILGEVPGCDVQPALVDTAAYRKFTRRIDRLAASNRGMERKAGQITLELQRCILHGAADQGAIEPGSQRCRREQRQIGIDAGDVESGYAAGHVDRAERFAALPAQWHQVGTGKRRPHPLLGKLHLAHVQQQLVIRLEAPVGLHVKLVESDHRLGEITGQAQFQRRRCQVEGAAAITGIDAAAQIIESRDCRYGCLCRHCRALGARRARRLCIEREVAEVTLDRVGRNIGVGSLPAGGEIL